MSGWRDLNWGTMLDWMKGIATRRSPLIVLLVLVALIVSLAPWIVERLRAPSTDPAIWLDTYPETVGPRSNDITVNFSGAVEPDDQAEWRLNDGPWADVGQGDPRAREPGFVIEIPAEQVLVEGPNALGIRITQPNGEQRQFDHSFTVERSDTPGAIMPEPHDGIWEWDPELSNVRPLTGHEGYDRIFILNPRIAGGRHVRAAVNFDRSTQNWTHRLRYGPQFGFGVVPLWGGHPDPDEVRPRRGWLYGLSWYYAREQGFGSEAANRQGADPIQVAKSYAGWSPQTSVRIDGFARPVFGSDSRFLGWCLVSVMTGEEGEVRADPLFVGPEILPLQDFAAALIAHRTAVSFREISWRPLPDIAVADGDGEQACAAYRPELPVGG